MKIYDSILRADAKRSIKFDPSNTRKSKAIGDPIQIEDRDDCAHPMPKRCLTWGLASATRAGGGLLLQLGQATPARMARTSLRSDARKALRL